MVVHSSSYTQKHFLHAHISLPDDQASGKGKQKVTNFMYISYCILFKQTLDEIWKRSSSQNLLPPEDIVLVRTQ